MNKDLIHSRFAKHLKDYKDNAKIQKIMAEKLISLCSKKEYKNILEIGCGTGFLTELAVKNLKFENYIAIDIVEDCELFIKKIDERINFICADIEKFDNIYPPDLIIANASLQWTENFSETVNHLVKHLNQGGELIFSTFGKENFREFFYIMGTSLEYYSETELKQMFPDAIIYPPEIHIMSFNEPKDVLKHLKLTGVNAIENTVWTKKDLKRFEQEYSSICGNKITLTYNPLYVKFAK